MSPAPYLASIIFLTFALMSGNYAVLSGNSITVAKSCKPARAIAVAIVCDTQDAQSKLQPGNKDHVGSRIRNRLLGYEIALLSFLGGLAAFAAGWFGGPLVFEGGNGLRRGAGLFIVSSGMLTCLGLWVWGFDGYALAIIDRSRWLFDFLLSGHG